MVRNMIRSVRSKRKTYANARTINVEVEGCLQVVDASLRVCIVLSVVQSWIGEDVLANNNNSSINTHTINTIIGDFSPIGDTVTKHIGFGFRDVLPNK